MEIEDKIAELTDYMFTIDNEAIKKRGIQTIINEKKDANDAILKVVKELEPDIQMLALKNLEIRIKAKSFNAAKGISKTQIEEFTKGACIDVQKNRLRNTNSEDAILNNDAKNILSSDEKELEELKDKKRNLLAEYMKDWDESKKDRVSGNLAKAEIDEKKIMEMDPNGKITEENVFKYFNGNQKLIKAFYVYASSNIKLSKTQNKEEQEREVKEIGKFDDIVEEMRHLEEEYPDTYRSIPRYRELQNSFDEMSENAMKAFNISKNQSIFSDLNYQKEHPEEVTMIKEEMENASELKVEAQAEVDDINKFTQSFIDSINKDLPKDKSTTTTKENQITKSDFIVAIEGFCNILSAVENSANLQEEIKKYIEDAQYSPAVKGILEKMSQNEQYIQASRDEESRDDLAMQLFDIQEQIENMDVDKDITQVYALLGISKITDKEIKPMYDASKDTIRIDEKQQDTPILSTELDGMYINGVYMEVDKDFSKIAMDAQEKGEDLVKAARRYLKNKELENRETNKALEGMNKQVEPEIIVVDESQEQVQEQTSNEQEKNENIVVIKKGKEGKIQVLRPVQFLKKSAIEFQQDSTKTGVTMPLIHAQQDLIAELAREEQRNGSGPVQENQRD